MKKRVGVILLVALALAVGISYWGYIKLKPPANSSLVATGTIEATSVELSAKVAGTVDKLKLEPGDQIKQGQLVGVIVRNDLVAQKERDALGVLKAQAQLADLTSGARAQEIKDAEALLNIADANLAKAKSDYERYDELFKAGALAEADFERISTDLKVKQSQFDSAQAKLSLLQSGNRPEVIKAAQMEEERSRAVLKASAAMLDDTKIISPMAGTVLTRNREPGEFVPAGASVATIVNLKDMWIKVFVPTDDLPKIKLGQQVNFTVSGSARKFTGVIEEIASQGEFTPKTIQTKQERANIVYGVKIRIGDYKGLLKPGMPADVVFD